MRIHHLNCATLCPPGGKLVDGSAGYFRTARLVCHVLLIETANGLVLVDAGLGLEDVEKASSRLGKTFLGLARPKLDPLETAARQVEWLGFRREDVRHIVLTHLDADHAGGIVDFPWARVHVLGAELHAASVRADPKEKERYRPVQLRHGPRWESYDEEGEPWFGFRAVRDLRGLPPEILLVPLEGHTRGHAGVAVDTGAGWLLHAGDAYFFRGEVHEAKPRCPHGLKVFQMYAGIDPVARAHNRKRLRALARERAGEVRIFCSHDPVEFEQARAMEEERHAPGRRIQA